MPAPTSARPARQGPWLHGKVALVTGGAGGIGLALSRALAAHGASVHAADNSPTNLARATQQLSAQSPAPGTITFHELDVSDHPAVKQWIADTHQEHGRIDILINNAAYIRWADVEETTVEEAERTMRVGYDAMVHTIKTVLPLMQDSRSGHIVNIGSSAGKVFVKGPSAAYAAMKAAVEGYTRILQLELSGTPVHAMLVRPGVVVGTDFFHHHVPPSRLPRLADFLPTTSPEQVAHAVLTGLRQGRPHVDIPGYLPTLYRAYALAPGIFSHLSSALGNAQGDYTTPRTPPRRSAPRPAGRLSGARRLLAAAGAQPAFVDAMAAITPPLDRAIHTLTAGRSTLFSALLPTLMLQTTGRKTGQPRRTPSSTPPNPPATSSSSPATSATPDTPPGAPTSSPTPTPPSPATAAPPPSPATSLPATTETTPGNNSSPSGLPTPPTHTAPDAPCGSSDSARTTPPDRTPASRRGDPPVAGPGPA